MLDKAVAAVKADKTKALDMFNSAQGGFQDRDLYVFCANAVHTSSPREGLQQERIGNPLPIRRPSTTCHRASLAALLRL
jgi:hypothetical protein